MSIPTRIHIIKLVYRTLLFLGAAVFLALRKTNPQLDPQLLFSIIWLISAAEMLLRFFPLKFESIGCQKQYAHTYRPSPVRKGAPIEFVSRKRVLTVAAVWGAVNAALGVAYWKGIIGQGALVLFSLFFSVCDMLCVLVFCPFQKWILKNRCCVSCRIYDWDYAMMFLPLVFIRSFYTWSLFLLGLGLLVKWEITVHRHPERFSRTTNASLSCASCKEKMCRYKKL